ncbi:MAG: hypothetical protein AAFZ18_32345 [Myxococcota bacterium]
MRDLDRGDPDAALVALLSRPGWRRKDVIRVLGVLGLQAHTEGREVGPAIQGCVRALWSQLALPEDASPEEVTEAIADLFESDPLDPALQEGLATLGRNTRLRQVPLPRSSNAGAALRASASGAGVLLEL